MKSLLVLLFCFELAIARVIDMDLTGDWLKESKWLLQCSWNLPEGDRLQSVRLKKESVQFLIYRPEIKGPNFKDSINTSDSIILISCRLDNERKGVCELEINIKDPSEFLEYFECEISGERPRFLIDKREYLLEPIIPAQVSIQIVKDYEESNKRVVLNCSGVGLPKPELKWFITSQPVRGDFSQESFDIVWSTLTFTPKKNTLMHVECLPQQRTKNQGLIKGPAAHYQLKQTGGAGQRSIETSVIALSILFLVTR